ncbi:MAG: C45 family peptidase [Victivallaceae bacterium]|nr:C45 family peptidase [Victivallaceae bacterium]
MKYFSLLFSAVLPCAVFGTAAECGEEVFSHECTSWMILHDLTKNNTHLLHKNRDAKYRNLMALKSPAGAPRKWIGLGDGNLDSPVRSVCMGMNVSGLAVVVNSGEPTVEPSRAGADMGTPAILRSCLENCDTAAQAVEHLRSFVATGKYSHGNRGSIFIFVDTKEGYIAEVTAERVSIVRYDHGYAFRANIWHNPDMASVADNAAPAFLNSCNREFMVLTALNAALRSRERIAVSDFRVMARDAQTPEKSPIDRTLCSKSTNSAATFEIDREFPGVLSTAYLWIGPPRHTVCVPVPVCVESYEEKMTDLVWSGAAWKRFDEKGFDAEVSPEWLEFEKNAEKTYGDARDKARFLLREGKKDEAVATLNSTASALWRDAEKLMGL